MENTRSMFLDLLLYPRHQNTLTQMVSLTPICLYNHRAWEEKKKVGISQDMGIFPYRTLLISSL